MSNFIPTLFGANYTSNRDLQADTPRSVQTQQNKVIGLYSVGINPDMGDIQGYQASLPGQSLEKQVTARSI